LVTGIFTGIAFSPGTSLRQFSDRYAFHAGLNLPGKGLRYFNTVRVTADVYCGFTQLALLRRERPPSLTLQHWSGVSLYTSSFELAETCVFDKQSSESRLLRPKQSLGSPYCELTDIDLPSSLTRFYPFTLARLCLPTCFGFRYGAY